MPDPDLVTPELLRGWRLPDPGTSKKSRGQVVVVGGARRTPGGVVVNVVEGPLALCAAAAADGSPSCACAYPAPVRLALI